MRSTRQDWKWVGVGRLLAIVLCLAVANGARAQQPTTATVENGVASEPAEPPMQPEPPMQIEPPEQPVETPAVTEPLAPVAAESGQPLTTATTSLVPPAGETVAPYLEKRQKLEIFDQPQSVKIDPIRRAAEQLLQQEAGRQAKPMGISPNLITFNFELEGANSKEIVEQARVSALQSAAARIYFDNFFLVGRDLLKNYLHANGAQFVVRTDVVGQRILANNRVAMRLKLSVDLDALNRNLREMRFIAEPNLRPIIAVLLEETTDGGVDPASDGRDRIEKTMQDFLFRIRSREMKQPALTTDVSTSIGRLNQARLEAQRHNVDILLTGSLAVRRVAHEQILYDQYHFLEARLRLKMYRVDNGELLQEVEDSYSASDLDPAQATDKLLSALVTRATRRLAENLRAEWDYIMLDKADYRLMICGLDPVRKPNALDDLKRFSPDMKIYEKAFYGGVWVVNLVVPGGKRDQLEVFLRESRHPQFRVEKVDERRFRLEVL